MWRRSGASREISDAGRIDPANLLTTPRAADAGRELLLLPDINKLHALTRVPLAAWSKTCVAPKTERDSAAAQACHGGRQGFFANWSQEGHD
jgi:hypothetical protein